MYCGFAEHDPYALPAMINQLTELLAGSDVRYRYEIHPGGGTRYALPNRGTYDKRAANRDWEIIFAMFRRELPLLNASSSVSRSASTQT